MKWLPGHTPEHTGKRVRTVIDALKAKGITVFGATGYCYGGMMLISCDRVVQGSSSFYSSPPRVRPCFREYHSSVRHCSPDPARGKGPRCAPLRDTCVCPLINVLAGIRREEQSTFALQLRRV